MKSTKNAIKFLATILVFMFICNCLSVISYASEQEIETTAKKETSYVIEPQNPEGSFFVNENSMLISTVQVRI